MHGRGRLQQAADTKLLRNPSIATGSARPAGGTPLTAAYAGPGVVGHQAAGMLDHQAPWASERRTVTSGYRNQRHPG